MTAWNARSTVRVQGWLRAHSIAREMLCSASPPTVSSSFADNLLCSLSSETSILPLSPRVVCSNCVILCRAAWLFHCIATKVVALRASGEALLSLMFPECSFSLLFMMLIMVAPLLVDGTEVAMDDEKVATSVGWHCAAVVQSSFDNSELYVRETVGGEITSVVTLRSNRSRSHVSITSSYACWACCQCTLRTVST